MNSPCIAFCIDQWLQNIFQVDKSLFTVLSLLKYCFPLPRGNFHIGERQGCVRGQHGRGQGQGSSRPRPQNFVLEVEASPRGPPSLGFLPRGATQRAVMPSGLSVHHSQRPSAASCACVWSIVFMVLSSLLINHTQKFNVLRPEPEAISQSQGRTSSRPRPKVFEAKATKFCPRGRGQSSRTPSLVKGYQTSIF